MFTHCSFDATMNKLDKLITGKDGMERFCKDLKEYATKIIYYKEKEMIPCKNMLCMQKRIYY